jgi:hypothetical protein
VSYRKAFAALSRELYKQTKPHAFISFLVKNGLVVISTVNDLTPIATPPAADPSVQIAADARMLLVSEHFLDDFRIGWSFSPRPKNADGAGNGAIIDNWTLNIFLQARAQDAKSQILEMPALRALRNSELSGLEISAKAAAAMTRRADASTKPAAASQPAPNFPVGAAFNVAARFEVIAKASPDHRYVLFTQPRLTLPQESVPATGTLPGAPSPASAPAPREFALQTISIPTGGTLLIDGGAVGDPSSHNTYRMLILIRPNIVLTEDAVPSTKPTTQTKP